MEIVPENDEAAKSKTCFVVSAIGDTDSEARIHGEWFLDGIINPAFEQFPQYTIKRSDLIRVPGMIDGQIINHLMDDDLVIADMTFLNANVFYEIGIRHVAQKPIIHMFRRDVTFKIPFDVHAFRAIEFEVHRPSMIKAAKEALIEYITATQQPGFKVENPVTRARGTQRLEQNATPTERVLLDRIEAIETRQNKYDDLNLKLSNPKINLSRLTNLKSFYFISLIIFFDPSIPTKSSFIDDIRDILGKLNIIDYELSSVNSAFFLSIRDHISENSINQIKHSIQNIQGVQNVITLKDPNK